jgi:hypothetical protein
MECVIEFDEPKMEDKSNAGETWSSMMVEERNQERLERLRRGTPIEGAYVSGSDTA